jgi:hypothetical protein
MAGDVATHADQRPGPRKQILGPVSNWLTASILKCDHGNGCAGGTREDGYLQPRQAARGEVPRVYQERRPHHLFSELTCGLGTGRLSTVFPFRQIVEGLNVLCGTARSVCSRAGILRTATVQSVDQ